MSPKTAFFTAATLDFLRELAKHNQREWFEPNKARYEADVRQPALRFIEAAAAGLAKISPEIVADPRPQGGSLMRIYRDVRFAKDKSPYKTNIGISFGHRQGRETAAPGYYVHVTPTESFSGGGIHMADTANLNRIRDAIVDDPTGWKKAAHSPRFEASQHLGGEALKKAPQGYPTDHPMVEDLKRKSFFAHASYAEAEVISGDFLDRFLENSRLEAPLMAFLAKAVGAAW
jgi:uncharacterized protein (TIGR02453 family)